MVAQRREWGWTSYSSMSGFLASSTGGGSLETIPIKNYRLVSPPCKQTVGSGGLFSPRRAMGFNGWENRDGKTRSLGSLFLRRGIFEDRTVTWLGPFEIGKDAAGRFLSPADVGAANDALGVQDHQFGGRFHVVTSAQA